MVNPQRLGQKGLSTALGLAFSAALVFGWATPAGAQAPSGGEQDGPRSDITEPTPLITVRPGPAVPPFPVPDMRDVPLDPMYFQPVGPFTMYMNVIASGPSQYGLFTAPGCVLDSIFKRGMKLVWRFEVFDMDSGMRLTDRDGSEVWIALPDGTMTKARFEPRGEPPNIPPDAPWTWVAVWNIPLDYPLGPVDFNVNIAAADGRTATLSPATLGGGVYVQVVQ